MNVAEIPQAEKKYILTDILKKRNHERHIGEDRTRKIQDRRKSERTRSTDYVTPESFVKKYRKQQRAFAYLKNKKQTIKSKLEQQDQNAAESLFDIPLNKTLIVIRIRGIDDISDQQKKILQWLRLKRVNSSVFVKSTRKVIRYLKLIENYVAYGIPNRQTITNLLQKRAYIIKDSQVVQLTGNTMIEQALGSKNVICTEDLIEEINNCGQNFMDVTKFLCPFKLNHPKSGMKSGQIKKPFKKGGQWGYRELKINDLLQQMI